MVSANNGCALDSAIGGEGEGAPNMTCPNASPAMVGGKCGKKNCKCGKKCGCKKGKCSCKGKGMKGGNVDGYEKLMAGAELEGGKKKKGSKGRKGRKGKMNGGGERFGSLTNTKEYKEWKDLDTMKNPRNAEQRKRLIELENILRNMESNKKQQREQPNATGNYNHPTNATQNQPSAPIINELPESSPPVGSKPNIGKNKSKQTGGEGCDGRVPAYDPAGVNAYDDTALTAGEVAEGGAKKGKGKKGCGKGKKRRGQKGGVAQVGQPMITGCIDRTTGGDPVPANTDASTVAQYEGGKGGKSGKKTYKIVEVDRNSKAVLKKLPMDKRLIAASGANGAGGKASTKLFKVAPKNKTLIRYTIEDVDSGKQFAYVSQKADIKKVKIGGVEREIQQYKKRSCNLSEVKA